MKIVDIRTLSGPNVYHDRPVLIMTLDLEDLAEIASNELDGFNDRLVALLPGLREHRCSPRRPGGFIERLERGTYFAHITEHIALELSGHAGIGVTWGKSIFGGSEGVYKVIVRYQAESGMRHLLASAVEIAEDLARARAIGPDRVAGILRETERVMGRQELGPSTRAIVNAAERRGIPWLRLNERNLIQLGYGKHRELIEATVTSRTSSIAVELAGDKDQTKAVLRKASIRVPRGEVVTSEEEALEAMIALDVPVAVKPLDGHQGKGVSLNIREELELRAAFRLARSHCRGDEACVVIEEHFVGRDYRVLVVAGKMIAAAERVPAHVMGDGERTLHELIEIENRDPRRGDGHAKELSRIEIDEAAENFMKKRGIKLQYVPKPGEIVFIRETANLSTGGSSEDVTDRVHPAIRRMCERAALIVGLDVCGIDLVIGDIAQDPADQRGGIIEVNAGPGIRMHQSPGKGEARDVGAAIVAHLFPPEKKFRIPIISVTGTNGKTTVTRMIDHVIASTGRVTGMTTTDGIYVGGVRVAEGDTTGPVSARTVLCDPEVEVAVLETARGGILRRGLGYDWSDIGVLTNIQPDHIGQDGIETVEDILHIKSLIAERVHEGGTLVLNADDEHLARLPENPRVARIKRQIVFFTLHPEHLGVRKHLDSGGTAYFPRDGWLIESLGGVEYPVVKVRDIPITFNGSARFQIANCLAAVAASRAQGVSIESVARALATFVPSRHNSGRANVYRVGQGYFMIDYGHNPDALRAVAEMTANWHGRRVTGVIGLPGDRDDSVIIEAARVAAQGFDRVIIREDLDLRGRAPGELARLICQSIHKEGVSNCEVVLDERKSIDRALETMEPGEVVVYFYDDLNLVLSHLSRHQPIPLDRIPDLDRAMQEAG